MADNPTPPSSLIQESSAAASSSGVRTSVVPPPRHPISLIILAILLIPGALSYALVTMNEVRVVAIILALLGAGAIIARPYWGLILFVGLLYTRPEESIAALQGMRLPLLISLLTLIALIFQKLLSREPAVKSPLNGMIAGFGACVVLSSLGSGNTSEAVFEALRIVVLVLLVVNLVCTEQRYRSFVTTLLTFTAYLSAYSIYLYFSGAGLARGRGPDAIMQSMATGIFADPNDLSATIVSGIGLTLMRLRQGKSMIPRAVYLSLIILMIWAIFLTNSRGGMLALIVVIGTFLLVNSRRKLLAMILAVIVGMAFVTFGPSRMSELDTQEESANSRFWFWATGVEHFVQKPLFGIGYKRFPDISNGYTAHNTFVQCFTEIGFIGYFCWMGCLYYGYRRRPASEAEDRSAGRAETGSAAAADLAAMDLLGARLALGGFLAAAFFLSRTYVPVLYILISLPVVQQISSQGSALSSLPGETSQQWLRDWGRIAMISAGSIILIYLIALRLR